MKNGKDMRAAQVEYRDIVVGLCLSCQKPQQAYWARYGNEGVCSSKCAKAHNATLTLKNADIRSYTKGFVWNV